MRYVSGMRAALRPRPRMPDEQMNALAILATTDLDSREKLVLECMGLIAHIAKRCRNTLGEDAFGEASVAFLEAIESYEEAQGDFRTWAMYVMTCRLADASRTEKRFRARIMRGEETLATDGPEPMPELLSRAVAAGAMTDRQARIVQAKAAGETREAIMDSFAISRPTYHREIERAMVALRSYL